jgi:uncharacterized membrane-anchored protein
LGRLSSLNHLVPNQKRFHPWVIWRDVFQIRGAATLFHDRLVVSNGLGLSRQGLCFLMEPVRGFLSIGLNGAFGHTFTG